MDAKLEIELHTAIIEAAVNLLDTIDQAPRYCVIEREFIAKRVNNIAKYATTDQARLDAMYVVIWRYMNLIDDLLQDEVLVDRDLALYAKFIMKVKSLQKNYAPWYRWYVELKSLCSLIFDTWRTVR